MGTLLKIEQDTVFTISARNFAYDECIAANRSSCAGAESRSGSVRVNVNAPPPPPASSTDRTYLAGAQTYSGYRGFYYDFTAAQHGRHRIAACASLVAPADKVPILITYTPE